jgi:NADPH:quinone reductase-like Zn-dependent oxidoreductase
VAAGVNPSDWKRRDGQYRHFEEVKFPSGFGVEASGVVDEVGPGVSNASVGDAVFGYGKNTMAQYAVLTHWADMPGDVPFEVAGGLPVIVETASRSLADLGVKSGQTLLVSGAAGGIGSAVIQLARRQGITVIGTASTQSMTICASSAPSRRHTDWVWRNAWKNSRQRACTLPSISPDRGSSQS